MGSKDLTAVPEGSDPHDPQRSIPDEDLLEEAIEDPNVLAEVTLPMKPSTFSSSTRSCCIN